MADEEWIKTLADGRNVKFIYQELPLDGAFITAQLEGNEVVYSVVLTKARTRLVVKMLKAISRASFQRSSTTHFGTLSTEPPIQTAPPHANHQSCFEPLIMTGWLPSGYVMQAIARSSSAKSKRKSAQKRAFDAQAFLDSAGVARKIAEYRRSQKIYAQGDPAASVMYFQTGGELSVVNEVGKEAVVGILGPGDFFGEGCLAGQRICMGTATAITPAAILVIEKDEMMRVLHAEHALSDRFMSYILSRNIRIEEDLIDQLFNSSEKRLARTLLLLARYGKDSQPQKMLPKVFQEMLAEMIGTTRSRVNFFMNKFRKLGFIRYNGGLQVHNSLLSVVLHD